MNSKGGQELKQSREREAESEGVDERMELSFRNKLISAPMVRVSTLPFRMLAAEYGADITYSEEIVDHKLLKCSRKVNVSLGTIDFVENRSGEVVFRTCSSEKDRVVLQIGTSNAMRALAAAELVCKDVAGIDINMGCPKSFSICGGMGAALLSKPELISDILTTLKRNLSIPVTCKIRLLNTHEATTALAQMIEKMGVSAIAVHARKIADRPRDPAQWDAITKVVSRVSIPVIANGDVFEYDDFQRIQNITGASSVMVARAAMQNVSIFRLKGKLPWEDVKVEYLRKCILWDNDVKTTKYTIKQMIMAYSCLELPEGKSVNACRSLADLSCMYGEQDYYQSILRQRNLLGKGTLD